MLFVSLLLAATTSISGCVTIKNAKDSAALLSASNALLNDAPNAFDYSNYNLIENEEMSFCKQELLSYATENQLISGDQVSYLEEQIRTSSDYKYFPSIKNAFMKDESTSERITFASDLVSFNNNIIFDDVSPLSVSSKTTNAKPTINKKEADSINTASLSFDSMMNGDGTGGGSNTESLPLNTTYDETKIASSSSGKVDETNFFGIVCTPETCIAVYNAVAKFVNNRNLYTASNIKGPLFTIYDTIKTFLTISGFSVYLAGSSASKISAVLDTIIAEFCALFDSFAPIAIIITTIIALFLSAAVHIFSWMIVCGSKGRGFAFGWKVHSLFNWEFYYGDVL